MKIKLPKMSLENAVIIVAVLALIRQIFNATKYSFEYQVIEIILLAVTVGLAVNTYFEENRSKKEE